MACETGLLEGLVAGQTLEDQGPWLWKRAVGLCRELGRALAATHQDGSCHGDLKPKNVRVGDDGQSVIVGLGLVQVAADDSGDVTDMPRYLAPEQAMGQPADVRTDVYALGLILAELVTGHPVRRGHDRSIVLAEATAGKGPDLSGVVSAPAAFVRVVRMATALQSNRRYQTVQAMVDDLDRLLAGQPVSARPPGLMTRRPRSTLAAIAVVLAVCIGGGLWLWGQIIGGRAERALASFEIAVLAYCEADEAAAQLATDATLDEVPEHAGALALLRLRGAEVASWGAGSPRVDALRDGILARSKERWPDAVVAFRAAVVAEPTCTLSRILLASALEQSGDIAAAERELTTAAELLTTSPGLLHSLGSLQSRRGDARAAAASYRRAAELRPESFSLRYRLALAYYGFDSKAALREAEAAVDLLEPGHDHERRRAEQLQASALNLLGRTREALEILQRLAEESPNDATACFNLAYALDRQQLIRDAKEWYEKALVIEPQNRSASLHLAWLLTTATQEDLRDLERAERMLLEVLERDAGQSQEVLLMVRDFGFRTGRIDALEAVMTRQIARPGLSKQRRAALEHARNQLRSGAPGTRR